MTLTHAPDRNNITFSVVYHIQNCQFNSGGSATTVKDKYDVTIRVGYPQNLRELELPHLALVMGSSRDRRVATWNRSEKSYLMTIYGFCGGLKGGEANVKQRDELLSDLENIFDPARSASSTIELIDSTTGSAGNRTILDEELRISEIAGAPVEAGVDDALESSKYRFRLTMTVGLWKSQ